MREKLMLRLSAMEFGMLECREFLDTHPNNTEALQLYNKYMEKHNALVKEYEEQFGPLTLNGINSDEWLQNPWPWDTENKE
jgi:spore coat protein JB